MPLFAKPEPPKTPKKGKRPRKGGRGPGKSMERYLRDVEFRWNHRGSLESRLDKLFEATAGPLPQKELLA